MLIRFGFSNFRSIKGYQEVSFVSSSISDNSASLISIDAIKEKLVPTVAIYGGNATGKSNLLRALEFIVNGVLGSHTRGNVDGGIPRERFLLDKSSKEDASVFDCDFIHDGVRFHYGFSVNDDKVLEEWLYAFPNRYKQIWFHRSLEENEPYYFGKFLKGKNRTIETLTRGNSLFLSSAAQNNHEMLTPIYKYFRNKIEFDFGRGSIPAHVLEGYLEDEEERNWLVKFLTSSDIGIVNIKVESDMDLVDSFPKEIIDLVIKRAKTSHEGDSEYDESENAEFLKGMLSKDVRIEHSCSDGSSVLFGLENESLGTRKLIAILGPIYEALKNGNLLVIDEIDTSMHPLLSRKLIQLFQSKETNPNFAQLLFSTHDTNLLEGGFLRRDQIWFTEKDNSNATTIFPLTDIETRKGDNIENGYLQGRFGAIPFLGKIDMLFDHMDDQ